ncbi:MAG: glycosyltransferase family 4 protein [Candidatus Thiodiazotropha sp.]
MTETRIKVLDLRDAPWFDGPGRTIIEVASGLESRGIDICIASFVSGKIDNANYLDKALEKGLQTFEIKENAIFDPKVVEQIVSICHSQRIDILHTHEFRSNVYGLHIARKLKLPIISTAHGWIANSFKRKIFSMIDKTILSLFFDRVIAVSDSVAHKIYASRLRNNSIVTVHNTLDTKGYRIHHDNGLRSRYAIPPQVPIIAKIGRLSPEKRQINLIRSIKRLVDAGYELRLLLIGVGPDEAELKALVAELGLQEIVLFTGFIREMQPVYSEVDLVVQASSTEGLPNVVLEAMLMRVPVIATDVGGTAEVINDESVGVLIRPGDDDQLTDSMRNFLDAPEQFRQKLDAAERRIRESFDSDMRLQKMAQIYRSVLPDTLS